jgi:hypothetical protein
VTVPLWFEGTGTVLIVKLLLVAPSAIVTVAGGVAAASVSLTATIATAASAGDECLFLLD